MWSTCQPSGPKVPSRSSQHGHAARSPAHLKPCRPAIQIERVTSEEAFSLSKPEAVALLRKDGLVTPRREGRTIYYSLAGDAPRRVLETLYELYCKEPGKTLPPASEMPPE